MATGSYLLNNLSTEAWFILPSVLQSYEQVLSQKFEGKHFERLSNIIELGASDSPKELVVQSGNKAIINIEGALLRKAGYLDAMCGVAGMDVYSEVFSNVADDPHIDHIILTWDSPGGTCIGTPEFAELVYNSRSKKRITSLIVGQMRSAAFFIGSAGHEIYSTSPINDVGSIGVVMLHVDQSARDMADGLKFTYIHAGKHKVEGNPHSGLSPETHAYLQKSVDFTYGVFLNSVAKYRGVTVEEMSKFADGQSFQTGQVVGTPLLDGITTLDEILRS